MSNNNNVLFSTDQNKSLKNISIGPKYLVIKRSDDQQTLQHVSPFLIKKVIDCVCGEVSSCKKLANGSILVKTKNYIQANKLIKLTSFTPEIKVEVSEHNSLNTTKGIIYDNSLRGISEEIILNEMKSQNVLEVRKILKREGDNLIETGLIIFTFSTTELPKDVHIGYEIRQVRDYIPLPMKCNKCHRFGHLSKFCNNTKLCYNCGNTSHSEDDSVLCNKDPCCINCKTDQLESNHPATYKKCPTFLKQKEIQTIKVTKKVDYKTAINIYKERVQQRHSYAAVTRSPITYNSLDHSTNTSKNNIPQIPVSSQNIAKPNQFFNLNTDVSPKNSSISTQNSKTDEKNSNKNLPSERKISILPRNSSKKLRRTLKAKSSMKRTEPTELNLSESSEDSVEMQEL